jgi:hypothetical protein
LLQVISLYLVGSNCAIKKIRLTHYIFLTLIVFRTAELEGGSCGNAIKTLEEVIMEELDGIAHLALRRVRVGRRVGEEMAAVNVLLIGIYQLLKEVLFLHLFCLL